MSPPDREELRRVAAAAVDAFLGEEASFELLGHAQCLTHRVTAPSGTYLLRVHAPLRPPANPAFFTVGAIESECAWLRALSAESDVVAPCPLPAPEGGHVLQGPRAGGAIPCTLLTWVEGEHLDGQRSPQQATRLGELFAALHEHARGWERPPGFERPSHDRAFWRTAVARVEDLVAPGIASRAEHALLARAVDQLDRELAPLARRPDRVGLIHGDLHGENYVFHGGWPRPIDFGHACIGPWLQDVAECLGHLGPGRRRDLVDAYAGRLPLEEGDLRHLEGYFLAALVEVFGNNAPHPAEHGYLARAIPGWAPYFERFTEGRSFLFDL